MYILFRFTLILVHNNIVLPTDNNHFSINMSPITESELHQRHSSVSIGGSWKPADCHSQSKMAIIIPYRDRAPHLNIMLNNLIPFLQYQKREFRIFVIEQVNHVTCYHPTCTVHVHVSASLIDNCLLLLHLAIYYHCNQPSYDISSTIIIVRTEHSLLIHVVYNHAGVREFNFQSNASIFNRAALLNVGFLESLKLDNFDCFVTHDVDLIPIHLCNIYQCTHQPRHLSVVYNKSKYR